MSMSKVERKKEDKKWERERPMREWLQEIRATDADMPRWMEDHISDDHGGVTGNPYQQDKYDKKRKIRARKPG